MLFNLLSSSLLSPGLFVNCVLLILLQCDISLSCEAFQMLILQAETINNVNYEKYHYQKRVD